MEFSESYVRARLDTLTLKLYLVKETTFKGPVEVGREVGRGNQDAVECLHFLQDNVLHSVVHLVNTTLHIRKSLAED